MDVIYLTSFLNRLDDKVWIICAPTPLTLKNKIMKIELKKIFCDPSKILKNISWPVSVCLIYFMIPTKTLQAPSYILT